MWYSVALAIDLQAKESGTPIGALSTEFSLVVNVLVAANGQHGALAQVVTAVLVHKAADKVRFIFR